MAIAQMTAGDDSFLCILIFIFYFHFLFFVGLMAITQMAAGDGFADIVGRRWGKTKWPWFVIFIFYFIFIFIFIFFIFFWICRYCRAMLGQEQVALLCYMYIYIYG